MTEAESFVSREVPEEPCSKDTRAALQRKRKRGRGSAVKVPKLRQQTFETAVLERIESSASVEEALIEVFGGGIGTRVEII
jgi:transposase-like protein